MTRHKCHACASGNHDCHESICKDEHGYFNCKCSVCYGYDADGTMERESRADNFRGF